MSKSLMVTDNKLMFQKIYKHASWGEKKSISKGISVSEIQAI